MLCLCVLLNANENASACAVRLWSESGVPLEVFLRMSSVTIYNTQTATRQTVSLDDLCSLYNVFYVVVPRFEKADGVLKIGIAQDVRSRFRSYRKTYKEHDPNKPLDGVNVHMLVVSRKSVCVAYKNSAICKLETHLKSRFKHRIDKLVSGEDRGTELFCCGLALMCEASVQAMRHSAVRDSQQMMNTPRQTCALKRSNSFNGDYATATATTKRPRQDGHTNVIERSSSLPHPCPCSFVIADTHDVAKGWQVGKVVARRNKHLVVCWYQSPLMQLGMSFVQKKVTQEQWRTETFLPVWVLVSNDVCGEDDTVEASSQDEYYGIKHPPNRPEKTWFQAYEMRKNVCVLYQFANLTSTFRLPDEVRTFLRKRFGDG